ncbi:MAG: molecular chaperone TorD family protein [Desulfuromonadales bacterium]|nr:molecular chaperone TorD family protein [Desulfuromonadales bacterium]
MALDDRHRIFDIFASLARYPGEEIAEAAEQGMAILEREHPTAAAGLAAFDAFVRQTPPLRREEIYTAAFDLHPLSPPYVGHQLFGESRERTLFLVRLREIYREHGHPPGPELPDHLAEILDFLARNPGTPEAEVLVADGLLPALEKMIAGLEGERGHPYLPLFRGMRDYLSAAFPAQRPVRKEATA